MKRLAALIMLLTAFAGPALAGSSYTMENRALLVFPGSRAERMSPYPMSKRAASVWQSDACWRGCTGYSALRFERCVPEFGPEACRAQFDADDRMCLRDCRPRGGPAVNLFE